MAIGTGLVMGYISSAIIIVYAPPINALIGSIIAFIIYQYVSLSRFFGSRRGEFEYEYRNDLAEKVIQKLVLRTFGICTFIKYFQDKFNAIRTTQKDICQSLLQKPKIAQDNENLYYIYYKLSNLELREDNFKEETKMLSYAIAIKPHDLLANFRLALCCEMDGLVDDAINYYKLASNDPYLISNEIKKYILSQVKRIEMRGPKNRPPEMRGPKNRPPALGAKYQAW